MTLIHLAQDILPQLADPATWSYPGQHLMAQFHPFDHNLLIAQFDTDVFAPFRRAVDHFIKSGQVWALLIGLVMGYIIRGITTYG